VVRFHNPLVCESPFLLPVPKKKDSLNNLNESLKKRESKNPSLRTFLRKFLKSEKFLKSPQENKRKAIGN
jgi:hypothetical protein